MRTPSYAFVGYASRMGGIIADRAQFSQAKLDALVRDARQLSVRREPLCIYVTGSYGRLEASTSSDLDLFLLLERKRPAATVKRLNFLRLAADLIALVDRHGFPEFSGDGEYLEVHNIARMKEQLGSRTEDAENSFTARLLLILESRPIVAEARYRRLLGQTVDFYFEDFSGHAEAFRPTFLINDILRFWRTLCINYEHRRREDRAEGTRKKLTLDEIRAKGELKNLKLGFSRLSTCYSMVVPLAAMSAPVTAEHVVALAGRSPLERWQTLTQPKKQLADLIARYEWFLEFTEDKNRVLTALQNPSTRADAKRRSKEFGDLVYRILDRTAHADQRRYLTT
jgi:Putative nucleotidyltransferase DUF294